MSNFKLLHLNTTQGMAGRLVRESQYVFNYNTEISNREISLTMPLTAKSYSSNILPGVIRQNLPEGFLRDWILQHFGKTMKMDDFNMMAITGKEMIGRVRCVVDEESDKKKADGESLSELLAWRGTEELFTHLSEKYAENSGISGVQPKVLLHQRVGSDQGVVEKTSMRDRALIVKAAGANYDGLAENEYHCMTIARRAGIVVPQFWLSDDKGLFIAERFDRDDQGTYLGFEDMTALTGCQNDDKYGSSYEICAKVVSKFASSSHVSQSLDELFKSLVLSVVVRNGDAHLKNFGMLYTTPNTEDIRLSPLYDIVNTTVYLPKDILALKLNKTKSWPDRQTLIDFGRVSCQVSRPEEIIDLIAECATSYVPDIDVGEIWFPIKEEIERGANSLSKGKIFGPFVPNLSMSQEKPIELCLTPKKIDNDNDCGM